LDEKKVEEAWYAKNHLDRPVYTYYGSRMRTTVDISDHLHAELLKLAAKRGLKGFSHIVEEALSQYLSTKKSQDRKTIKALKPRGKPSENEADELLDSAEELRAT
jgi:hypothetical protein